MATWSTQPSRKMFNLYCYWYVLAWMGIFVRAWNMKKQQLFLWININISEIYKFIFVNSIIDTIHRLLTFKTFIPTRPNVFWDNIFRRSRLLKTQGKSKMQSALNALNSFSYVTEKWWSIGEAHSKLMDDNNDPGSWFKNGRDCHK